MKKHNWPMSFLRPNILQGQWRGPVGYSGRVRPSVSVTLRTGLSLEQEGKWVLLPIPGEANSVQGSS